MARSLWSDYVPPSPKAPPQLVPIFGPKAFTPATTCRDIHPHGPIPPGSVLCCAACHASGVEHLVSGHTKPGNGQIRDEWQAATPTAYAPPPTPGRPALKGGRR
jgi:hypothetical protein